MVLFRVSMMYVLLLLALPSCFSLAPRSSCTINPRKRMKALEASPADILPHLDMVGLFDNFNFDQFMQSALNAATRTENVEVTMGVNTAAQDFAEAPRALNPLGNDLLIFLCATIGIVPFFKALDASPVLGFLSAGILMGPAGLGLFSDMADMEALADFGVLFLLFEQGLELTVDRLRSLAKYAFGYGTLQVLLCTLAFFLFPFLGGVQFLELVAQATPDVVDITRVDEALVIGAALSLSSSAFVLKILQESGKMGSKVGSASLGILLLQDIAVVPLLVLLPIIESRVGTGPMPLSEQLTLVGDTVAKAVVGLGGILVVGGAIVRFLFSLVAKSKSSETFVALCLLVALGMGQLTDQIGLSSTLGAFTAGTLLAESNYRTQIESDIKPFRGILLGLFFLTTGASVDPSVIGAQFPTVVALLSGLIVFKAVITSLIGPLFGLTRGESVKTGLLLAGGGEFAFVVFTLAGKLDVLPPELVKILIGVVVLSMALTPTLSEIGDILAKYLDRIDRKALVEVGNDDGSIVGTYMELREAEDGFDSAGVQDSDDATSDAVVICGFNLVGEAVVKCMRESRETDVLTAAASAVSTTVAAADVTSPSPSGFDPGFASKSLAGVEATEVITNAGSDAQAEVPAPSPPRYVAFDLDPEYVVSGFKRGFNILYGDGSNPAVLETAGVHNPRAFVLTGTDYDETFKSIERLRSRWPDVPIIARGASVKKSSGLMAAGAIVEPDELQIGLQLGGRVLSVMGMEEREVRSIRDGLRITLTKEIGEKIQSRKVRKRETDLIKGRGVARLQGRLQENELFGGVIDSLSRTFLDQRRLVARDQSEGSVSGIVSEPIIQTDIGEIGGDDKLTPDRDTIELGFNDTVDGVDICAMPPKKRPSAATQEDDDGDANDGNFIDADQNEGEGWMAASSLGVLDSEGNLVEGVDICKMPEKKS